jgi:16S rRNA pseudouridine516 synthase
VKVRLDRLLANLGYGSRREVQAMIAFGAVSLEGEVLTDPGARLEPSPKMLVAGEPIDPLFPLTLVINKPLGVVCSHREAGRSVFELLPSRWRRRAPALSTVGRLDADTSGLLLMTDDGALLHRIISPKRHVPKQYHSTLARPLTGGESALFASGSLILEGEAKPLAPALLEALSPMTARLTLSEGRYHQARRMFAAAGNHVLALHREAIGALALPVDLSPGAWRIASEAELAAVLAGT